jgi:hypothetical protein
MMRNASFIQAHKLSDPFRGLLPINCVFLAFACAASASSFQILRLVVRDQEGKLYSVRYDAVNAMLLNKFELISSYCVCSERPGSKFHQS